MGISLQNITITPRPNASVQRWTMAFQYSADDQNTWQTFSFLIPEDLVDIHPDRREAVARDIIFAIAHGRGYIDENNEPVNP